MVRNYMIIINMILKVPGKFDNKTQIKKHLYDNDDVLPLLEVF